mmetsp:Transcript_8853/g.29230  ORF Transcript_8853/g.29230 Transcript_8853/m.29230 type:complete len:227 (-) Transcript_8853:236-916(-)
MVQRSAARSPGASWKRCTARWPAVVTSCTSHVGAPGSTSPPRRASASAATATSVPGGGSVAGSVQSSALGSGLRAQLRSACTRNAFASPSGAGTSRNAMAASVGAQEMPGGGAPRATIFVSLAFASCGAAVCETSLAPGEERTRLPRPAQTETWSSPPSSSRTASRKPRRRPSGANKTECASAPPPQVGAASLRRQGAPRSQRSHAGVASWRKTPARPSTLSKGTR